jgi:bifunctional DNase/RNase
MVEYIYQLVFDRVEPAAGGAATVVFAVEPRAGELHVRLNADESVSLMAERAGLSTPRLRVARTLGRLVEQMDASLEEVRLSRIDGAIVASSLIASRGLTQIDLPVGFGEAVALAMTHGLPIVGHESLRTLLRTPQMMSEPDVALPPTIVSFVNSLADR